jgi:S1-C subfamily serine protease
VGKLIIDGKVRRGYLGIAGQVAPLPQRMIAGLHLDVKSGILVQQIEPDTPADNSELSQGDVIIGFNGDPINSIDDLHKMLNENTIGKKLELLVLRRGRKEKVRVTPAELK